jgi:16S rRNA pseudouridine516 synthase
METLRLDKYLKDLGIGTRSEIREIIKKGRVTVDGEVCRDPGFHAEPGRNEVCLDGKPVSYNKYVYVMLNKPKGVITATEDKRLKTALNLLPEKYRLMGVFPVGRLDRDTAGLLIFTNNGDLAHNLLSPKKHVMKQYEAHLDRYPGDSSIEAFRQGVEISGDFKALPANLRYLGTQPAVAIVEVYEGKFHQVKRMFKAVGAGVTALKRLRMGNLELDRSLKPGEWRELTDAEVKLLMDG